jgi:hypothetical protein
MEVVRVGGVVVVAVARRQEGCGLSVLVKYEFEGISLASGTLEKQVCQRPLFWQQVAQWRPLFGSKALRAKQIPNTNFPKCISIFFFTPLSRRQGNHNRGIM